MTEEFSILASKMILVTKHPDHIEQHSFLQSLTLHLLPGVFIVMVFVITAPLFSMLPVVCAVWWKRNVNLGIIIHACLNILGGLALFAFLLGR